MRIDGNVFSPTSWPIGKMLAAAIVGLTNLTTATAWNIFQVPPPPPPPSTNYGFVAMCLTGVAMLAGSIFYCVSTATRSSSAPRAPEPVANVTATFTPPFQRKLNEIILRNPQWGCNCTEEDRGELAALVIAHSSPGQINFDDVVYSILILADNGPAASEAIRSALDILYAQMPRKLKEPKTGRALYTIAKAAQMNASQIAESLMDLRPDRSRDSWERQHEGKSIDEKLQGRLQEQALRTLLKQLDKLAPQMNASEVASCLVSLQFEGNVQTEAVFELAKRTPAVAEQMTTKEVVDSLGKINSGLSGPEFGPQYHESLLELRFAKKFDPKIKPARPEEIQPMNPKYLAKETALKALADQVPRLANEMNLSEIASSLEELRDIQSKEEHLEILTLFKSRVIALAPNMSLQLINLFAREYESAHMDVRREVMETLVMQMTTLAGMMSRDEVRDRLKNYPDLNDSLKDPLVKRVVALSGQWEKSEFLLVLDVFSASPLYKSVLDGLKAEIPRFLPEMTAEDFYSVQQIIVKPQIEDEATTRVIGELAKHMLALVPTMPLHRVKYIITEFAGSGVRNESTTNLMNALALRLAVLLEDRGGDVTKDGDLIQRAYSVELLRGFATFDVNSDPIKGLISTLVGTFTWEQAVKHFEKLAITNLRNPTMTIIMTALAAQIARFPYATDDNKETFTLLETLKKALSCDLPSEALIPAMTVLIGNLNVLKRLEHSRKVPNMIYLPSEFKSGDRKDIPTQLANFDVLVKHGVIPEEFRDTWTQALEGKMELT